MKPASEIMRDALVLELIPRARELGRDELADKLTEAVELGENKYADYPAYWEGIRLFATNGIEIAEWGHQDEHDV